MYLDFEELAILMVLVAGFSLMVYGLITLVKNIAKKCKAIGTDKSGTISVEKKKDILDVIKLLFGAQVIGVLFYITPAINENIKIILSLGVTLASFIATFLIKEKKGYNGLCRGLIFIGQEFFGITMLLMMINKGMGYSVAVIFGIWSLFNLYIAKEFGNIENKILCGITSIVFLGALLGEWADEISLIMTIIITAIILLALHIFSNKDSLLVKAISNILFTILTIMTIYGVVETMETPLLMFGITLVFALGLAIGLSILKTANLRAVLMYIPFLVMILSIEFSSEVLAFISLFNVIFAVLLTSNGSIYKNILGFLTALIFGLAVSEIVNIDTMAYVMIYVSAVIVCFAHYITPKKVEELVEGGDDDE